jgi:hypothetical protein
MKINVARFRPLVLAFLCLVNFPVAPSRAQEVSIPDPGLNAHNVSGIEGLETARNLVSLDLQVNRLTLPADLTRLVMFGYIDQVIMTSLAKNRGPAGGG